MTATGQAWSRITIPVSGAAGESVALEIAAQIAEAFAAELNVLFAPPDPAELSPWLGEGFMGTVQMSTLDSLKAASEESELMARSQFGALPYGGKIFAALESPVWQDLACEARLSDLVIFGETSAKGQGMLAEAFQQILMEERAGVFVARRPLTVEGANAIVAWDGKEPSSRAARRAVPLLKKAARVVVVGSPVGDRPANLDRLVQYYAAHGINADIDSFPKGEIHSQLCDAYERHGASYMVAGAFGRSRLREFVFGGTTRHLLQNTSLNLYMAH